MSAATGNGAFPQQVTALRRILRNQGYAPVPTSGKATFLPRWPEATVNADDAELRRWETTFSYEVRGKPRTYRGHEHLNTGIACGTVIGLDIDVPVPALAARVEELARVALGATRLRRIGNAPKVLLCYRAAAPMRQAETPELYLDDGTKVQVEALGAGKQFVAFGTHPDTGREYVWPDMAPDVIAADALPTITEDGLREFLGATETMLRQAGGRTKTEREAAELGEAPPPPPPGTDKARRAQSGATGNGEGFFQALNAAALADLDAWVLKLFPRAVKQDGTGAYRVTSRDLGRGYQEDLSIHPRGIQDFGPRKGMSPCDVVMEFGRVPSLKDAAFMLCDCLGAEPAAFGWTSGSGADRKPSRSPGTDKGDGGRDGAENGNQRASDQGGGRQDGADWRSALVLSDKGKPSACEANAAAIIAGHPALAGCIWHDDFASKPVLRRAPPWAGKRDATGWRDRPVEDADLASLVIWTQRETGLMVSPPKVQTAIAAVSRERRFHPVRDYLSGLAWDGVPRIDGWLHTYLRAAPTEYHVAVGPRWLIGAVARVFDPGCKLDTALILEGTQGLRKSTVAAILAGEWFTDTMPDLTDKDAMHQLQGVWIVELAELSALNRSESNRVKSFMSSRSDRFRPAFGRVPQDFPRQCAFVGTVNPEGGYLKDPTGARRFWVVRCGGETDTEKADTDALRRDRDQLWAEAVHRYRAGSPWWLNTEALEAAAQEEQEARYVGDAKDTLISEWVACNAKVDEEGHRSVSVPQVLEGALGILDRSRWTQAEQNLVSRCLTSMSWMRKRIGPRGRREWRYFPRPGT